MRHHGVEHQLEADLRVPPNPRLRPRLPERRRPSLAELRHAVVDIRPVVHRAGLLGRGGPPEISRASRSLPPWSW